MGFYTKTVLFLEKKTVAEELGKGGKLGSKLLALSPPSLPFLLFYESSRLSQLQPLLVVSPQLVASLHFIISYSHLFDPLLDSM